ncbi:MAG: Glycosyltransferase Gtf1 [Haliscomenobacter sp.]|nr:Glycosyltransferase Gtf1 [Haliscomenobacter sp.]
MKVLFLGTGDSPPTFIKRRIGALYNANIIVILLSPFRKNKIRSEEAIFIPDFKVRNLSDILHIIVLFILSPIRAINFLKIIKISKNNLSRSDFFRAIRYAEIPTSQPDLVHAQWIAQVPEIAWMRDLLGVPIIASVRGSMVTVYPHKHAGYEQTLQTAFQLSDRLHFVSKGLLDFCVERFAVDKNKCFVNYNGIDIKRFCPAEQRPNRGEEISLISVGSLIWRKNFQDLLKIVQQSNFWNRITLKIIGDGDERFILEFMIRKYGLAGRVELLGKLPEETIIRHLQDTDIYLSTSYAEGLSNAVMEAASCGLPVIAFDCEGMDEIIRPDVSGIIIPHGRTDLFVQSLDQLIENKILRQEMGMAARQHVVKNFDESKQIEAIIREYQNLIDEYQSKNK